MMMGVEFACSDLAVTWKAFRLSFILFHDKNTALEGFVGTLRRYGESLQLHGQRMPCVQSGS